MSDRLDIVEAADWSRARTLDVRIVDGSYRPMVLYLEKDMPYVLAVENADIIPHDFWAPGFLKQGVALESVQIGSQAPAKGCVNGVRVAPRSRVALKFVPVWEGRYEMSGGPLPLLGGALTDGVFHIVQPRVGIAAR